MPAFEDYYAVLARHLPLPTNVNLEQGLVEAGLDSLGTIRLVVDLEEALGTRIPDDFMTSETFKSVGSLWSILSQTHQ